MINKSITHIKLVILCYLLYEVWFVFFFSTYHVYKLWKCEVGYTYPGLIHLRKADCFGNPHCNWYHWTWIRWGHQRVLLSNLPSPPPLFFLTPPPWMGCWSELPSSFLLGFAKGLLWLTHLDRKNRVHMGHVKPGKSWNLRISFSRFWKHLSWKVMENEVHCTK